VLDGRIALLHRHQHARTRRFCRQICKYDHVLIIKPRARGSTWRPARPPARRLCAKTSRGPPRRLSSTQSAKHNRLSDQPLCGVGWVARQSGATRHGSARARRCPLWSVGRRISKAPGNPRPPPEQTPAVAGAAPVKVSRLAHIMAGHPVLPVEGAGRGELLSSAVEKVVGRARRAGAARRTALPPLGAGARVRLVRAGALRAAPRCSTTSAQVPTPRSQTQ
jgi:hypothetical protein